MEYKEKACVICNKTYLPTGRCSKYCVECKVEVAKQQQIDGQYAYRRRKGMRIGRGSVKGEKASYYKHGKSVFDRFARERKEEIQCCEECGKDLTNASRWGWVGHHIDHNPLNNVIENLKLLCKRCHQIEHKCWKAFEGVTTIRKE